ncbi:MAG: bestrophin family protein [Gammaproteobacteria bacterium]|nr:bestrophin family protein [Gammaproteobacteria bacterium]
MIVRPRPNALHLFFVRRGSIFPHIASKLLSITLLSCVVVGLYESGWMQWLSHVSAPPFSLLGLALSVFLGFRNSACYERWWEARKQWGELIIQARGLARECQALLPGDDNARLRRLTIERCIAFAHALAAHLRGQDAAAACTAWLSPDELKALRQRRNVPDTLLNWINQDLALCVREQRLSDVLYRGLEQRLDTLASSQAICERIKSTPTPFAYTLLLHRTAWLFCMLLPFGLVGSLELLTPVLVTIIAYTFFGLDALGDELEEPFGLSDNDLPLSAMVRGIEIDLLENLGDALPEPLQPQGYILQ